MEGKEEVAVTTPSNSMGRSTPDCFSSNTPVLDGINNDENADQVMDDDDFVERFCNPIVSNVNGEDYIDFKKFVLHELSLLKENQKETEEVGLLRQEVVVLKDENKKLQIELGKKESMNVVLCELIKEGLSNVKAKEIPSISQENQQQKVNPQSSMDDEFVTVRRKNNGNQSQQGFQNENHKSYQNNHQKGFQTKNRYQNLSIPDDIDENYTSNPGPSRHLNLQSKRNSYQHNKEKLKTVPGKQLYSDATAGKKEVFIIGTSMVKNIKMKRFNQHLNRCSSRLRAFPGASALQLQHYALPTLVDDKPDSVIIHGGCNDVSKDHKDPTSIANEIIGIATLCKNNNVRNVCISSLIARSDEVLNKKVQAINANLKEACKQLNIHFLSNWNINKDNHLWDDGLHLNNSGIFTLSCNFTGFFNSLYDTY